VVPKFTRFSKINRGGINMNILIIDDSSEKYSLICKVLKEIEGISRNNITQCLSLIDARELLQERLYDFLILDLNLPEEVGGDNKETAGIEFLEEIIGIDSYIKPIEIIILTEYPKLSDKFSDIIKSFSFTLLPYSTQSYEWIQTIKGKVKYRLLAIDSLEFVEPRFFTDVAFITAVDVETNELKNISDKWDKKQFNIDPTFYYETEIEVKNKILKVVRAQQAEMGMAAAAVLTSKIIDHYKPRYIIMTGIAAGVGDGKSFGDIIIPSIVWNYSSGKYVEEESSPLPQFKPAPSSINLDVNIAEIVKLNFQEVLNKISHDYPDTTLPRDRLKIIIGPMACGSAVVANKSIIDSLVKEHNRKTVGLDMESYGVFYAVEHCAGKKPTVICMKSISDFADGDKGDVYQKYAAYTSASFARYFIELIYNEYKNLTIH
jgi:nucleoside phosphorylase/CheY-like chemotaxis protein